MTDVIDGLVEREYAFGFESDIETERAPKGLNEDVIRLISAKKDEPEWLLEWRLAAYRHFITMVEPDWAKVQHPPIDYQDMYYWAAPKPKGPALKSLDEVDPEIRATFDKLGISLAEQERLSGVAVDAIIDSVSVATTFKAKLAEVGVIFCSFSEAVREHPDLVDRAAAQGRSLYCWTVDAADDVDYCHDLGVAWIATNHPGRTRGQLEAGQAGAG